MFGLTRMFSFRVLFSIQSYNLHSERVQCSRQRLIFSHVWPYTQVLIEFLPDRVTDIPA